MDITNKLEEARKFINQALIGLSEHNKRLEIIEDTPEQSEIAGLLKDYAVINELIPAPLLLLAAARITELERILKVVQDYGQEGLQLDEQIDAKIEQALKC